MSDRLEPLCLLPPAAGTAWTDRPVAGPHRLIGRPGDEPVEIELPLFWYEPLWYRIEPRMADMVATSVASAGVLVSALCSELRFEDDPLTLFELTTRSAIGLSTPQFARYQDPDTYLPRIVPYRPERYGLSAQDFEGARIIDLRLTPHRDPSGRHAFSPAQLARWETPRRDEETDDDASILEGLFENWAPAAALPPDVPSLDQLAIKLDQLRRLAPSAAMFVSITPHRMNAEIPKLVGTGIDGLILQLSELPLSGMELGLLTRAARRLLAAAGAPSLPLALVPGDVSPDDAVKLMMLGASAVAIDPWCSGLFEGAEEAVQSSPAARLQQVNPREIDQLHVYQAVQEMLHPSLERFQGLYQRMQSLPAGERLGSLDAQWAKTFEVPWIAIGRGAAGKSTDSAAANS